MSTQFNYNARTLRECQVLSLALAKYKTRASILSEYNKTVNRKDNPFIFRRTLLQYLTINQSFAMFCMSFTY